MIIKILKILGMIILSLILFYTSLLLFFPIEFTETVDDDHSLPSITFDGYKFHSGNFRKS